MHRITLSSGVSYSAEVNVSILNAAARAGVSLPYSCKTGRCSACKCKVFAGETKTLQEEIGLNAAEKADGLILTCVRTALTDLNLGVEDLGGIVLPEARTLPCRIYSTEKLAHDVVRVLLRLPPTSDFHFIPGQYIDVIGPGGARRSYSIANASFRDKQLELHIRAVDGGAMSHYWFEQVKENDLLRLNGPLGTFFLRDVTGLDLVFLATGTGIAPVKAMLESVHDKPAGKQPRSVNIFWGGRTQQDLYFNVMGVIGRFNFVPVLSRANAQWKGARGHVQQAMLAALPNLSQVTVYACGSDAMIRDAKTSLTAAGLLSNRFYSDAFVCSATI